VISLFLSFAEMLKALGARAVLCSKSSSTNHTIHAHWFSTKPSRIGSQPLGTLFWFISFQFLPQSPRNLRLAALQFRIPRSPLPSPSKLPRVAAHPWSLLRANLQAHCCCFRWDPFSINNLFWRYAGHFKISRMLVFCFGFEI